MTDGEAPSAARRTRVRRQRSVTESLLSIVLMLEGFLVFFAALVAFGLRSLEPALALGGGGILILLLIVCGGVLRFPWGVWLGWMLQLALILTGIVLPLMYFIGAGFLALWIFCFVKGRQIDAQRAAYLAAHPLDQTPDTPNPKENTP